jgi:hypothetical protein
MDPTFVPTNSRRVLFYNGYKMSGMLPVFVDGDPPDPRVDVDARVREEPEEGDDDEENDDKEDQDDDDGNSDGYSE